MDNCYFSFSNNEHIGWYKDKLVELFDKNKLPLQQWITNDVHFQQVLDSQDEEKTPQIVKLLGVQWDRVEDKLLNPPLHLDKGANTKQYFFTALR